MNDLTATEVDIRWNAWVARIRAAQELQIEPMVDTLLDIITKRIMIVRLIEILKKESLRGSS